MPKRSLQFGDQASAEGGFDGARDSAGDFSMSETSIHRWWPNWIVFMTKRSKVMCVCD